MDMRWRVGASPMDRAGPPEAIVMPKGRRRQHCVTLSVRRLSIARSKLQLREIALPILVAATCQHLAVAAQQHDVIVSGRNKAPDASC